MAFLLTFSVPGFGYTLSYVTYGFTGLTKAVFYSVIFTYFYVEPHELILILMSTSVWQQVFPRRGF